MRAEMAAALAKRGRTWGAGNAAILRDVRKGMAPASFRHERPAVSAFSLDLHSTVSTLQRVRISGLVTHIPAAP